MSENHRGRLAALAAALAREAKPFRELTPEERRARLLRLQGAGRGLTSGSEELAKRKAEDIEIDVASRRLADRAALCLKGDEIWTSTVRAIMLPDACGIPPGDRLWRSGEVRP